VIENKHYRYCAVFNFFFDKSDLTVCTLTGDKKKIGGKAKTSSNEEDHTSCEFRKHPGCSRQTSKKKKKIANTFGNTEPPTMYIVSCTMYSKFSPFSTYSLLLVSTT
jgi:hypothetical protein